MDGKRICRVDKGGDLRVKVPFFRRKKKPAPREEPGRDKEQEEIEKRLKELG